MRQSIILFLAAVVFWVALPGCETADSTQQAVLHRHTTLPATRYKPATRPQPDPAETKIRLLQAQATSRAHLAEIEARKAERLQKLALQQAATVARLQSETTQKVKRLELEQAQNTNAAQTHIADVRSRAVVAIEKERQIHAVARQKAQIGFYQNLLMAGIILVLLLMLLLYRLYRHRQALRLTLHEDQLRHQAYLEASRQQHEKVTKILEIIADASTDKGLKKELTRMLKEQQERPTALLEH